jgi:hypothetical protein
MTSRSVFTAAAVLVAGLLSVGFLSPRPEDRTTPADAEGGYPFDGRAGGRHGVNGVADPVLPPNVPTNAELDAIFADEVRRKQDHARDEGAKRPKRSFWDRMLGRDKHEAGRAEPAAR